MTRRTPLAKAVATGRVLHDRKRFKDRNEPESTGPLGPPPAWMTNKNQRAAWEKFRAEIPWLEKSHRCLTVIACVAHAGLVSGGDFDVRNANLLRQCLGQMGATPVDSSKITLPGDEAPDDPAEKYFS